MEKREVSLEINQWVEHQTQEEETREHFKLLTIGEYVKLKTFSRIVYLDENGAKIELKWRPSGAAGSHDVLEIKQPAYSLFFNLSKRTVTQYLTPQGVWELEVKTLALEQQAFEGGQRLDLSYEIMLNEELLGKYDFQLIYK